MRVQTTTWLEEDERQALEAAARRLGLSLNLTLRIALRTGLGLASGPLAESVRGGERVSS